MASIAAPDVLDGRHAIDAPDETFGFVKWQDRRGLGAIFGHARAHRLLIVVGPALEFGRPADVADTVDLGRLEAVVIAARRTSRR